MFTVYAIRSQKRNYTYIGMTNDLKRRLRQHNNAKSPATKAYVPFHLIYSEGFSTRPKARNKEKFLKSGSGREWLKSKSAQVAKLVDAYV